MLSDMRAGPMRVVLFTLALAWLFMVGGLRSAEAQVAGAAPESLPPPEAGSAATEPQQLIAVDDSPGYEDTDPSALTEFRDELEPYGEWVEDSTYGVVWVPYESEVGPDFAPYVTAGHWELTADGDWLWASDYEWGWAPFHYGRWVWIPDRGWAWIPGRMYAPAWVVWRVGDPGYGYIGWAPMPPYYYWSGGVAVSLWFYPPAPYVFCGTHFVFHHHVHRHLVHQHRVGAVARNTRPYQPATPAPGRQAARPRGPSPQEANIPASALPKTRVPHDPRALALAKPSRSGAQLGQSRAVPNDSRRQVPKATPGAGLSRPRYRGAPSQLAPSARQARPLATSPRGTLRPGPNSSPSFRAVPQQRPQLAPRGRVQRPRSLQPDRASPPAYYGRQPRAVAPSPGYRPVPRAGTVQRPWAPPQSVQRHSGAPTMRPVAPPQSARPSVVRPRHNAAPPSRGAAPSRGGAGRIKRR